MDYSKGKSAGITSPVSPPKHQLREVDRKPRIPLSCGPCRGRKLKCNREHPCQNCTVRGTPTACLYADSSRGNVGKAANDRHIGDVHQRIGRLESLITNIASREGVQTETSLNTVPWTSANGTLPDRGSQSYYRPTEYEQLRHGIGIMKVDDDHSSYTGSSHWDDVFDELDELKNVCNQLHEDRYDQGNRSPFSETVNGPSLFCGFIKPIAKAELLQTLPPKPAVDSLVSRFFSERDTPLPSIHLLHKHTFMKQYNDHWSDPSTTKIMWLGLLFSMLSMTMLSYNVRQDEPPEYEGISDSLFELYRIRTVQCLLLADITKGASDTLETLIFYAMLEYSRGHDHEKNLWILIGPVVRIALQMGYHRDPSHFKNISIFQGELRRRVWCFIQGLDALASFSVGLPGMIRAVEQDTAEPRSLHDWEWSESTTELPPGRPESEATPVAYMVAKRRILLVLGDIVEFISSLQPFSYETVLELDTQLLKARSRIPQRLKMHDDPSVISTVSCAGEPPSLQPQRMSLAFLYHQGMCILHRKHLATSRSDPRFSLSRTRCIESAIALLSQQNILYMEKRVKGGGQEPSKRRWYDIPFTSHIFIIAALILCLELHHGGSGPGSAESHQSREILHALGRAREIWYDAQCSGDSSPEAPKVYAVLSQMLSTFEQQQQQQHTSGPHPTESPSIVSEDILHDTESMDWATWDSFIYEGGSASFFDDAFAASMSPG